MKSLVFLFVFLTSAGYTQIKNETPIQVVERVANKVIKSTTWKYKLQPASQKPAFDFLSITDLNRTYSGQDKASAYLFSYLTVKRDTIINLQLSHSGDAKIWINEQEVYRKTGYAKAQFMQKEREFQLSDSFKVNLKKGRNPLLIKSVKTGPEWRIFMQPKGSLIEFSPVQGIELGFAGSEDATPELATMSRWLCVGPFNGLNNALDRIEGPENGLAIGQMYKGSNGPITWEIPRVEVLADVIGGNPAWGSYFTYNYHAAGLAWSMAALSQYTSNKQYDNHARHYTDFMIQTKTFVNYEVNELFGYRATQHHMVNTPLLDFTAAPGLPFVQRLLLEPNMPNAAEYRKWVDDTKEYVMKRQVRLPDGTFTRETPEKYTTWVDDMFMGIPFLVYCALEEKQPGKKAQYFDEACKQVLGFNKNVFDPKANLYHHSTTTARITNIPYWSRANGWGIFGASVVLENLPTTHPLRPKILAIYKKHVEAIVKYQDQKSGFWHQVINDPSSYEETSATGIFTMVIAKGLNNGWISGSKYRTAAENGWKALLTQIELDGTVHNICLGTMTSESVDYYKKRPVADDDSHGLLGLLWTGIEMDKLLKKP